VARVSAATSALVSSYVTTAVLSLYETTALLTPATASRLFRTMNGQSAQYMFCTANVTVLSAARAVEEARTPTAMAAQPSRLLMGILRSSPEDPGWAEIKSERSAGKEARENEPGLDEPVRQRTRASIAVGARELRRPIYQPVAVAEATYGHRDEV